MAQPNQHTPGDNLGEGYRTERSQKQRRRASGPGVDEKRAKDVRKGLPERVHALEQAVTALGRAEFDGR